VRRGRKRKNPDLKLQDNCWENCMTARRKRIRNGRRKAEDGEALGCGGCGGLYRGGKEVRRRRRGGEGGEGRREGKGVPCMPA
jgi:hypothetical protein